MATGDPPKNKTFRALNKHDVSGNEATPIKNKERSEVALLKNFCEFLEEHGYTDDDWRTEKPTAIEKFLSNDR